jgi:hypothetical protein
MKLRIVLPAMACALIIVAATFLGIKIYGGSPTASNRPGKTIYAFQPLNWNSSDDAGQTDIMAGTRLIASQPGSSSIFSPNGRYLLSSNSSSLYIYDLETARKYSRPLVYQPPEGCVAQAIGNKYVYVADPVLIRYSLPGFSHPMDLSSKLPSGPICTVASIGNNAIVVVDSRNGWQLYEVGPDGTSKHIGPNPLWPAYEWAALASNVMTPTLRASNGDPEIAYESFDTETVGPRIFILDLRTNSVFQVGTAELAVPSSGNGQANGLYLGSLWWANDGDLYAVLASEEDNTPVAQQQIWKLDNRSWIPWSTEPLVDERSLSNGDTLAMEPEAGYLSRPWGDLYLRSDGKSFLIRKAANDITVPLSETAPPQSTASQVRTSVNVAVGQHIVETSKGISGEVRPSIVVLSKDDSFTLTHAKWFQWNSSSAAASGVAAVQVATSGNSLRISDFPVVATFSDPLKVCGAYYWGEVKLHYTEGVPPRAMQDNWWVFDLQDTCTPGS